MLLRLQRSSGRRNIGHSEIGHTHDNDGTGIRNRRNTQRNPLRLFHQVLELRKRETLSIRKVRGRHVHAWQSRCTAGKVSRRGRRRQRQCCCCGHGTRRMIQFWYLIFFDRWCCCCGGGCGRHWRGWITAIAATATAISWWCVHIERNLHIVDRIVASIQACAIIPPGSFPVLQLLWQRRRFLSSKRWWSRNSAIPDVNWLLSFSNLSPLTCDEALSFWIKAFLSGSDSSSTKLSLIPSMSIVNSFGSCCVHCCCCSCSCFCCCCFHCLCCCCCCICCCTCAMFSSRNRRFAVASFNCCCYCCCCCCRQDYCCISFAGIGIIACMAGFTRNLNCVKSYGLVHPKNRSRTGFIFSREGQFCQPNGQHFVIMSPPGGSGRMSLRAGRSFLCGMFKLALLYTELAEDIARTSFHGRHALGGRWLWLSP